MEDVDVVAPHSAQDRGHLRRDLIALAPADRTHAIDERTHARRRIRHLRFRPEARDGAIGKQCIDGLDVVHHVAVGDRARSAGIVAGHPAERRLRRGADIDREPQSVRPQPCVEGVEDDAGLDDDGARVAIE